LIDSHVGTWKGEARIPALGNFPSARRERRQVAIANLFFPGEWRFGEHQYIQEGSEVKFFMPLFKSFRFQNYGVDLFTSRQGKKE
jgi:hypothetical protein